MRRLLFLLALSLVMVACNKEEFELPSLQSEEKEISYVVTPEEAVNRLQMFLSKNGTRASLNKFTIKTLRQSDFIPATRSTDAEDAPAIYLIDIPDGGCAIMGADKRLEPVYAIMDETKLSPEDLTTATTRTESADEEDIQTFVTGLINDAVEADIMGIPIIRDTTELIPNPLPHSEFWYDTVSYNYVAPLIETKWHQHEPFNNNYPICTDGIRKPAGCGVIAAAQLVYNKRVPKLYNGLVFDWGLIGFYEHPEYPSISADIAVANFVYTIANAVGANLNDNRSDGTYTTLPGIKNFFKYNGYGNANFYSYSLPAIKTMLNNQKPVIISGFQSNGGESHTWLIDGCETITIDVWVREYIFPVPIVGDPYNEYIQETINGNLLHCNYGWGGSCDGYYTSGIFDTRDYLPDYLIDESVGDVPDEKNNYYDLNLSIMQY